MCTHIPISERGWGDVVNRFCLHKAPGAGNGAPENQAAPAPANPPAENEAAADNPNIQMDPVEDMEVDNEDEDDAGAEDAGDANNGAQGTISRRRRLALP